MWADVHMWADVNNIDAANVTGNLVIVSNLVIFQEEIMVVVAHLRIIRLQMGQIGPKMRKKHQCLGFSVEKYHIIAVFDHHFLTLCFGY